MQICMYSVLLIYFFHIKVSVFVTDVNDCPPKFDHDNYTAKVQEGSPIGYTILTVTTTDCDYYSNNTNVTYMLVGNRSGKK